MSFGIIEIITLMLGLSGFGLQPNPKAPTADQALEYAMPDADLVVHLDVGSVVPANYKLLMHLPEDPRIKASPELSQMLRQMITQVEGMRGLAKSMTGLDFTTDLNDTTAFIKLTARGQMPDVVVESHGNFTPALLDKIAQTMHATVSKTAAGAFIDTGDDELAITKNGVLLAGTTSLIKDRMSGTWKAPSHAAGTNLGHAADVIAGKPVFAFVITMSAAARELALDNVGRTNFVSDVIRRHKVAALAIYHDGIGWTWTDSTKAGLDSMAMMSDGLLEVFRAGQIAPRGLAKIALGGLESYRAADPRIAELLAHKDDLMKIVVAFTGDGSFKVQNDKDAKSLTLHVRATGKTLSEVVPLGGFLPFMALGAMMELRGGSPSAVHKTDTSVPAIATPPHH